MKNVIAIRFEGERGWSQAELDFETAVTLVDESSTYTELLYIGEGRLIRYKPNEIPCDSSISKTDDSGS